MSVNRELLLAKLVWGIISQGDTSVDTKKNKNNNNLYRNKTSSIFSYKKNFSLFQQTSFKRDID